MPFVSKSQQRLCFSLKAKGKNGSWDCNKWQSVTKGKLPKKVSAKKK